MYAALWRLLPGPLWVRITTVTVLAAVVVALLMFVVYPWVASLTTIPESTVE